MKETKTILIEETQIKAQGSPYTDITFRIIGQREENSMKIPFWEKTLSLSEVELAQALDSSMAIKMKMNNARIVFDRFYADNFK